MDNKIIEFLKTKGRQIERPTNIDADIKLWNDWYNGYVDGFHRYLLHNGEKKVKKELKTLKMAETVCQDWADLLLNEKVDIVASDSVVNERLHSLLPKVHFYSKANQLLERAFALGGGYLIQYWDGKQTNQKYITQDKMIPLSYDSAGLKEAAFSSSKIIDGKKYTYLETHTLDNHGNYIIDNYLLTESSDGMSLAETSNDFMTKHNLSPKINTNSPTPKFQCIMPNKANKNDGNNPYGTSVFAGAIDVLKCIDLIYDSFANEFTLGRKRIFVADGAMAMNVTKDGKVVEAFDPTDSVFYHLPDDNDNGQPIIESNLELRIAEHTTALQTQLNILGQKCGFGENHYKWENGNVTTATQVISENSKMFRTLQKHEILLRTSIVNMARSLMETEAENNGDFNLPADCTFTVNFDDSIIEDTSEKQRMALTDYNAGLISAQEYYRIKYGFDDKQANEFVKKMIDEKNAESEMSTVEEEPTME